MLKLKSEKIDIGTNKIFKTELVYIMWKLYGYPKQAFQTMIIA